MKAIPYIFLVRMLEILAHYKIFKTFKLSWLTIDPFLIFNDVKSITNRVIVISRSNVPFKATTRRDIIRVYMVSFNCGMRPHKNTCSIYDAFFLPRVFN